MKLCRGPQLRLSCLPPCRTLPPCKTLPPESRARLGQSGQRDRQRSKQRAKQRDKRKP